MAIAAGLVAPAATFSTMPQKLAQRAFAVDRKAAELGDLTEQNGECDAIHVAVADGLGEQLGNETELGESGGNAQQARNDCHHAADANGTLRVACRQRGHHAEEDCGEGRVGTEDQDGARAKHRVGEQRHNGRVKAGDARQPRCLRVSDTHWNKHGRHHKAGHDVSS
jgi:hypothetical protein